MLMETVTLSLKPEIAGRAKQLAEQQGVSISEVFTQFVESVPRPTDLDHLPPLTRAASGLVRLPEGETRSVRELVEEAIMEKYL